tara:strand:+ start:3543 stop:3875 length:333 start_codon:yes stop_codon:yes gene_type:complete
MSSNNNSNNSITLDSLISELYKESVFQGASVVEQQKRILEQLDRMERLVAETREHVNGGMYYGNTQLSECAGRIVVLNAEAAGMNQKLAVYQRLHDLACTARVSTCNEGN